MYSSTIVNLYKNPDLTEISTATTATTTISTNGTISGNQHYVPLFECGPSSLDINTTFPTPKDEDCYLFEGSPQSSNNGQMTPLSPCSITDQQNHTFIYNSNPVMTEIPAPEPLPLSNLKMPLVTHHASNDVIKDDNNQFIPSEYTTLATRMIINQPVPVENHQNRGETPSQNSINEQTNKQDIVYTPTNFKHMSREQLIARLLFLENKKNASNQSKSQQQHVQSHCRWKNCGKKFDNLKKLISHLTEFHVGGGKASYQCEWEECPRKDHPFTKRHKMHNHLRTHTGERPFTCTKPDCKKKFSRLDSLTTHLKTHSNIRPYACSAAGCGKAYYHSRSLKKHEKIHEVSPSPEENTSAPSPPNMIPQQQPFIPFDQFMYGEKISLVDTCNYNTFMLNTNQ